MFFSFLALFLALFAAMTTIILRGLPLISYEGLISQAHKKAFSQINLVADLKKARLKEWISEKQRDIGVLAANRLLAHSAIEPLHSQKNAHKELVKLLHDLKVSDTVYSGIYLLSPDGRSILASSGSAESEQRDLDSGDIVMSIPPGQKEAIIINSRNGKLFLHISRKIDAPNSQRAFAILTARIILDGIIPSMFHAGEGLGKTGEVLLVNRVGLLLTPLRHRLEDGTVAQPFSYHIRDIPAKMAAGGHEGSLTLHDYRGKQVLAAFRHLRLSSELGLGLVVKIDKEELYAHLQRILQTLSVFLALSAILVALISYFLSTRLTRGLTRLSSTAARAEAGDLTARANMTRNDEVGRLAQSFDAMLVRLEDMQRNLERKVELRTAELKQELVEREHAERMLQQNEQILRIFIENSPAAIAMLDRDMNYLVVSHRFLADYRLGGQNIIGRSHYDVFPEMPQRWREIHNRCLAGVVEKCEEEPFARSDGTTDWIRWEIRPWYDTQDTIGGIILMSEVISEQIIAKQELLHHRDNLEKSIKERTAELQDSQKALLNLVEDLNIKTGELEVANAKLMELDRLKSMFIASMSHELRTPLNSIIGFSGIMLQGLSGEINGEQRDHLERVFRAGKHLLSLITDVIDIAKIESGKIHPYREDFDLLELIEEAVKSMQVLTREKGLELVTVIPETPVRMQSDRKRLLQCLLNFLSNAVKFSEKGAVTVTVTRGQGVPDGRVEISVSDTGIGIREQDLPLLFGSFVRFDSHLKTTSPGTGLGLYLTKKLAEEVLKGEVGAESEEGKGSRFWIRVPAVLNDE